MRRIRLVIAVLGAASCRTECGDARHEAPIADLSTCPDFACTPEVCGGPERAVACCIESQGRGVDEETVASAECQGSCDCVEGACDPADLITPAAALCAARAMDFEVGLSCDVDLLVMNGAYRWRVNTLLREACEEGDTGLHSRLEYQAFLDAGSGLAELAAVESSTIACGGP